MVDAELAQRFAEPWYAAWNRHDLNAILEHYTDDVELVAPLVSKLAGSAGGRLVGKKALRAYFAAGLERFPSLRFEPLDLLVGVESLVLRYLGPTGVEAAEVVFLNADGRSPGTSRTTHVGPVPPVRRRASPPARLRRRPERAEAGARRALRARARCTGGSPRP